MNKKIEVTIKKVSSNEPNVSKRHTSYDVYHNGKYHTTFNDINDAMDHKEKMHKEDMDLDETVLSIQQRQKRAQVMRRNKSKIERAREIAKKKMAPEANIRKRAFVQARQIIRRRVAGERGAEYEKLGPTEKMIIDRAVEGKQKIIKKLALRLIPRVKQAESKRLQTFMKGQQLQNQGQPEGKSKESSGSSSVKESLNALFSEAFPPSDTSSAMGQRADSPVTSSDKKMPPKGKSKNPAIIQHSKFQEELEFDTPAFTSLFKKSEKYGIDLTILGEVYDRGWNTWSEDYRVSQQQYAFARVNSYINQGKTYFNEDSDLHEGGLWDNIHAKRRRIKTGSGERMRRPGSEGAPTKQNFKDASESVNENYDVNSKHYKALTDLDLNTKNRDMTAQNDGYGPLNPMDKKGSKAFWDEKAKMWNTTTEAAMEARCGNCAAFNQSPAVMKKMAEGLGPAGKKIQDLADLGFCELFEFKCAGARTCNKWLVNGPITEQDTANGTSLVDKESNNSKVRKKIDVVDRKLPFQGITRQAEIKHKVIDENKTCPICDGKGCKCKAGNVESDPNKREIGTDSLVKTYKADTPFSKSIDESFNIAFAAGVGVTLTAADLGMKVQSGFAYHPSVQKQMDEMEEEVRSADVRGTVVHTASGKTIIRKQKVDRKIIGSGNLTDGKPDDTL